MAIKRTRPDADLEIPRTVDAQDIARRMEREHGCEGVTVDARRGKVLGLRYTDDVASTHVQRDLSEFTQRARRGGGSRLISLPPRKGRK